MHNVPRYLPNLCRSLGFMVLCCLAAMRWCCPLQPLHSVMSAAMQRLTVVRCRAALIAVLMLVASHSVWCFAALAVFLLQACVACFCVVRPCARLVWGPVHCWSPAFPLLPVPAPVCCFRLSSVLPLVELCRSRCLKVCNPSNGYWLRLPDQQFALLTAGSSRRLHALQRARTWLCPCSPCIFLPAVTAASAKPSHYLYRHGESSINVQWTCSLRLMQRSCIPACLVKGKQWVR